MLVAQAVCVFVNERDKRIFVTYTDNALLLHYRHFNDMVRGRHPVSLMQQDKALIEFNVLLKLDKGQSLYGRYRANKYVEMYKDLGYTFYIEPKPFKVTVKVEVIETDKRIVPVINIVDSRNKKYLVKKFSILQQAEEFLKNTSLDELMEML